MANSFITITEIARAMLPRLIENLVFPNLVHKDFSSDFVQGKGTKIQVKKPIVLNANEFNESDGVSTQDIKESSVEVTLDHLATVDLEIGAIQMAANLTDLNSQVIEPAAIALAQKINSDGLNLYKDVPYVTGTAGTTPSTIAAFKDVRRLLNENKVPMTDRKAVWDTDADANFTTLDCILHAEKSGSTAALREGSIGRVFGLDNYMSQAVKKHEKGTLSATGSGATINVKTAVDAADSVVLDTTGSALSGTLVKGDLLTIGGKTYTVTELATAASDEITVKVYPKLTAAADAVVAIIGNHTANLAFNPQAFAFVTRPLVAPSDKQCYVTSWNGASLRVVRGYDMRYKKEMISADVLYGYKTMYPELAVRALG